MLKTLFVLFCGLALWACQPTSDPFETKGEDNVIQWNQALLSSSNTRSSSSIWLGSHEFLTADSLSIYMISRCTGRLPDSVKQFDIIVNNDLSTAICTQRHCAIKNPLCSNFNPKSLDSNWAQSSMTYTNLNRQILQAVDFSQHNPWTLRPHSLDSLKAGYALFLQTSWIQTQKNGQSLLSIPAGTYAFSQKTDLPESLSIQGADPKLTRIVQMSTSTDTLRLGPSAKISNTSLVLKNLNKVSLVGNNTLTNIQLYINHPQFYLPAGSRSTFDKVQITATSQSGGTTWFKMGRHSQFQAKNMRWSGINRADTLLSLDSSKVSFESAEMTGSNWKSTAIIRPGDTLAWHKGTISAPISFLQTSTKSLVSSTEGTSTGTKVYNTLVYSGFLDLSELSYSGLWFGPSFRDGDYLVLQSTETISGKSYAITNHQYKFGSLTCSKVWGQSLAGTDTLFCGASLP